MKSTIISFSDDTIKHFFNDVGRFMQLEYSGISVFLKVAPAVAAVD